MSGTKLHSRNLPGVLAHSQPASGSNHLQPALTPGPVFLQYTRTLPRKYWTTVLDSENGKRIKISKGVFKRARAQNLGGDGGIFQEGS